MADVKAHFTSTSTNISLLPKYCLRCSCKVCNELATMAWRQHPHMKSQHNKNMTTSRFDFFLIHSIHLQIVWLMCLGVDIHVGLVFIVILLEKYTLEKL